MPRVTRLKNTRHAAAVPLKRTLAADEATASALDSADVSVDEAPAPAHPHPFARPKRERPERALKPAPAAAVAAASASASGSSHVVDPTRLHPYSRSHRKRENRKRRGELAGGLGGVRRALDAVTHAPGAGEGARGASGAGGASTDKVAGARDGKIGEGKGKTLSEHARRKQIASNAKRIPAVMKHPAFAANPWATIRLHASNTLVKDGAGAA
ncbi:hypothetical protein Q5752_003143 [Cryptotrichosporon argae]